MSGRSVQIGMTKAIIQFPAQMEYKTIQKAQKRGAILWNQTTQNVSFEEDLFYVMTATVQATEYLQECLIHRIQEWVIQALDA